MNTRALRMFVPAVPRMIWNLWNNLPIVASIDITKACNLRCPYCYELPYLVKLSDDDGITVKSLRELCSHLRRVHKIKFAVIVGGEPGLVRMRERVEVVSQNFPFSWLVTNGLPDPLDRQYNIYGQFSNVFVIVSIDGIKEAHDNSRKRNGLFDTIVERFWDKPILTTTTLHVGNRNEPRRIVEYFMCSRILAHAFEFATPIASKPIPGVHLIEKKRDVVINDLHRLKDEFPRKVAISHYMLEMMRTDAVAKWGGPKRCPSVSHALSFTLDRKTGGWVQKIPCVLAGGASLKPNCRFCGCHVPTVFLGMKKDPSTFAQVLWFLK